MLPSSQSRASPYKGDRECERHTDIHSRPLHTRLVGAAFAGLVLAWASRSPAKPAAAWRFEEADRRSREAIA